MKRMKEGFTLLEIMSVVMIVGLLATLSFPSYQKSRENAQRTVCINNLRIMQHAADRYLFDRPGLTEISPEDLNEYYAPNYPPDCPAKGGYSIQVNDGDPQAYCDYGSGHVLN